MKFPIQFSISELLLIFSAFWPNLLISTTEAIAINNSLVGLPEVDCGPNAIRVRGITEQPFFGVVYIKNWRRQPGCFRSFGDDSALREPQLDVPLDNLANCGMQIKRNPETRDVEIRGVWVFSFHPMFVTKIDKAYSIHCIFRQKEITVTNELSILDIVTRDTITATAAMPNVELRIVPGRDPNAELQAVSTVKVGDPITFIWLTRTTSEMLGIRVKDCFVETLKGQRVKIVENGCSLDHVAISDLIYDPDMQRAHAQAQAFKFADASDLWFKCTVTVCIKPSNNSESDFCSPAVEKNCKAKRNRRAAEIRELNETALVSEKISTSIINNEDTNVAEQKIVVLDFYNQNGAKINASRPLTLKEHMGKKIVLYEPRYSPYRKPWTICLRKPVFALISSVCLLIYTATFILGAFGVVIYCKNRRQKSEESPLFLEMLKQYYRRPRN